MSIKDFWVFSEGEKRKVRSLLEKGRAEQARSEKFAIIDFDSFYKLFDADEVAVIKKFLAIDPKRLDYKLPYLGLVDTPSDIVAIPAQKYLEKGTEQTLPCQYLPANVHTAYERLIESIQAELSKKLLVLYGYRSPARQVFIFFDILERIYDFDFTKTIQRVAFPAYSEHVCPSKQAIDFMTQGGVKGDGFDLTQEYSWLKLNAGKFGFVETYPKDNQFGMMYEPWHWRFDTTTKD